MGWLRGALSTLALGGVVMGGVVMGGVVMGGCASTPMGEAGLPPCDGSGCAPEADAGRLPTESPPEPPGDGPGPGPQPACFTDSDCGRGAACVGGSCCGSLAAVCGSACCGEGEVCLADRCERPGATCVTDDECAAGDYCEPALGDGASAPTVDGPFCHHQPPALGRCIRAPRACEAGDGPGADCVETCEYRLPPGRLDAVVAWHWGSEARERPADVDVWSTPTVGRVTDTNCDGRVDHLDTPNLVFVSNDVQGTCCQCVDREVSNCLSGVLRVLDGQTGEEVWSLARAADGSVGFAGVSVALGDVTGDGRLEIVAVTGEGNIAVIGGDGQVLALGDQPLSEATATTFGWGGGLALADMDGDGVLEVAYGRTVYSIAAGTVALRFTGTGGRGSAANRALSVFGDVDGDGMSELIAGRTAYRADGSRLWHNADVGDGFPAVADFDLDGRPEVVVVAAGQVWILSGLDGAIRLGPHTLASAGLGGPPTVADLDGDGAPEIGVAQKDFYFALKPNFDAGTLDEFWRAPNHDFSSSVTGSTVFDFEGDGKVEVVYNDECFLWVYDGQTGDVLFATPTTSFTATEAAIVADVDGDQHAEVVMVSNGINPATWKCNVAPWDQPDPAHNRPAWAPPQGGTAYRGITVFRDAERRWVGTRALWNQHSYHVSNVCDRADDACEGELPTGTVPAQPRPNWSVPWLNNFRQNVQGAGLYDAPDATVTLSVACGAELEVTASVRNQGQAPLPAGVRVQLVTETGGRETPLSELATTTRLLPRQVDRLRFELPPGVARDAAFVARIVVDEASRSFRECREDNNTSQPVRARCVF